MSEIFSNTQDLRTQADIRSERLIVTSGGFDPMHVGHLRCILESGNLARELGVRTRLAVIVNGDGFLARKKAVKGKKTILRRRRKGRKNLSTVKQKANRK